MGLALGSLSFVMPAKAGIQTDPPWTPAFAGVTTR